MIDKDKVGFYIFINFETKEFYVGSGQLYFRESDHYFKLRSGTHKNKDLQHAYNFNKHFEFLFQETNTREEAFDIEQLYLDTYKDSPLMLNKAPDARLGKNSGWVQTETANEKNRQAHLGKKASEETKKLLSAQRLGKQFSLGYKHPPEFGAKISRANMGHSVSQETREKQRLGNLGKKRSLESINKMKIAQSGKIVSEETRIKMSIARTGLKRSLETKLKIGLANKGKVRSQEILDKLNKRVLIENVIYPSIKKAAIDLNMKRSAIDGRIRSKNFPEWKQL